MRSAVRGRGHRLGRARYRVGCRRHVAQSWRHRKGTGTARWAWCGRDARRARRARTAGAVRRSHRCARGAACWALPLIGLIVGAIAALVLLGAAWIGMTPAVAAGLALAAAVLVTGGLHEDGLADTADGLGGGKDRDHKLAIMRDSRIGSYGVLALMLTLGLRWSALTA